ncbi:mechanosensitive ion channel family protein [Altererythrobacter sp.]|uniref:mechanosensitive ion channel family protein n=1 Tax=Altererythrobacter sp. TaxID=1872480 RepID=UPI003D0C7CC2
MAQTINNQLSTMWYGFAESIPSLSIALILLMVTGIIASFAVKIADRLIGKTELRPSLRNLIETLVKLGVWLLGWFIAAIVVFPDLTFGSLIAGLGIGAVAIGFAFQDIFENFLAGVLIMLREKMRIGDIIECEGITGKVDHITLRETHIRSASGELTVVPNSILFKNPVEILTDVEQRCHTVVVGVAYDSDLDKASEVIRKAVESAEGVDAAKGIDVFAHEFNSSSIDFLVRWWAGSTPRAGHESRDRIVRGIKRGLDEAGIEIPFPYITHTFKDKVPLGNVD